MRTNIQEITQKRGREKITVLTAYTAPFARILDPHVDILLVGDSLGMVLYGFENTLPVTLDMMCLHGAAVVRASQQALVVVDMPYGTVEHGRDVALKNCQRVLTETGAQAVKIEGGVEMKETIAHLTANGVAVMGHVGLMPQHVEQMGGYKIQGKDSASEMKTMADAKAVEAAGAFAVVIEGTVEKLAREITALLSIPTIGIGASPACDGQVLVSEDMAGLSGSNYKFVQRFGEVGEVLEQAVKAYVEAVRSGAFPKAENCF